MVPSATPGNLWLAETIRLRESQWGPLQDSNELRRARTVGTDFTQRLLLRARYLGQREGLDTLIRQWTRGARLAFLVLLALAIMTGAAAALGALGDGSRQVNLALALVALLGLHILTFVFWCISGLLPSGNAHTVLGDIWLWLTRKLARGPQAALVPRALASMLARQGALRPLLGGISHALWLVALAAMLLTLLALLSARRYVFSWETTLLSPDAFVAMTRALGWLPSKLGFSIPPDPIIRASDGLQFLPESAHALWSGWLIGCLVCYGLLPRLLALAFTALSALRRIKNLHLDTGLPGYIELRDRLEPASISGGIDAPAPADLPVPHDRPHSATMHSGHALVGLELASDEPWPPAGASLPSRVSDLGVIDDRPQRQNLLDMLQAHPPQKLLIVCDGRQTPDRGLTALILELTRLASQAQVVIYIPDPVSGAASGPAERLNTWTQTLQHAGLAAHTIQTDMAKAITWLAQSPDNNTLTDRAS